jgi:hypothetical protein
MQAGETGIIARGVRQDRTVSRYAHPLAGAALLRTPELAARHPAEIAQTVTQNSYDEGAGCGFDNGSGDAYAERWVEVDAGAREVLAWFVTTFAALGWNPVEPVPSTGVAYVRLQRDGDERAGVLLQGLTSDWTRHADRAVNWESGVNRIRVHLAVDGTFPDGSTGFHVG